MSISRLKVPTRSVLANYGLVADEYVRIGKYQKWRCPICEKAFTRLRVPVIDHDHRTGQVRGLLCSPCNQAIGAIHDDAEWLYNAAAYIRHPITGSCLDEVPKVRNSPPTKGQA